MNINWDEKPEWAIGHATITNDEDDTLGVWFDAFKYKYTDTPKQYLFGQGWKRSDLSNEQYPPETKPSQVMTWQPIETAPKDGTVIDLWYPTEPQRVVNCRWYKKNKYWGTVAAHRSDHIDTRCEEPTHWMIAVNPENKSEWNVLESLPCIGEECQLKPYGHKVTIIAHHDSEEGTRIVFWDHHALVYGYSHRPDYFRTFKTDKEKWVDQVIRIYDEKDEGARENFARLYDAMQSGILLPTPKGYNIDRTGVAALDALYDAMVSGEQPYKR